MLQEVIDNCSKLFDRVFSIHFFKHVVMGCLDGNVDEREDSWMVKEVSDCAEMVKHVRWVGHTDSHHDSFVVFELITERNEQI